MITLCTKKQNKKKNREETKHLFGSGGRINVL
jgi:hypothetical protein